VGDLVDGYTPTHEVTVELTRVVCKRALSDGHRPREVR
jgi:hypothetical protein